MRKNMFVPAFLGISFAAGLTCDAQGSRDNPQAQKPNLIFVFSDQQSFDMLGCYGNKEIKTPNLDKLASQGVRFSHCISSCPVCTPYRGILLSGMHPLNNGTLVNDIQMLKGEGNYFGEVLTRAGYHTGYYGKWHLYGGDRVRPIPQGPYRYGFDQEFLSNNCTMLYDSLRSYFWNEKGEKELYGDWEWNAQTRQALEFLDKNAGGHQPVALFLSWHAPHDWMAGGVREHKYSAPVEFEKMYNPDKITLRKNCEDTRKHRLYYQGHMAMISSLDRDFGLILKKLEEKGIADNSLIIFTSDHGDLLESHNWPFNKGRPEMESIRVPLIMKWTGKLKPRTSNLLVGTLDLMPTILGLLELPVPETCQGLDLAKDITKARDNSVKSVPLFYFAGDWRGVYTHDFTYTFSLEKGKAEAHAINAGFPENNVLYDHRNDRFELNNLYADPSHEKIRQKLHALSLSWMNKFNDRGIPSSRLLPTVIWEEDYRIMVLPHADKPAGFETRLKGRPVDYQ